MKSIPHLELLTVEAGMPPWPARWQLREWICQALLLQTTYNYPAAKGENLPTDFANPQTNFANTVRYPKKKYNNNNKRT